MLFLLSFRLNLLLFSWKTLFSHRGKMCKTFRFNFHLSRSSSVTCLVRRWYLFMLRRWYCRKVQKRRFLVEKLVNWKKNLHLIMIARSRVNGFCTCNFLFSLLTTSNQNTWAFKLFLQLRNKWTRVKKLSHVEFVKIEIAHLRIENSLLVFVLHFNLPWD
jgi:hypothetical protein